MHPGQADEIELAKEQRSGQTEELSQDSRVRTRSGSEKGSGQFVAVALGIKPRASRMQAST